MIICIVVFAMYTGSSVDIAQDYFLRGSEYADQGDYARAIGEYNKAVHLEPTYGVYRFVLGSAYLKEENYREALVHLKKAVLYNPGFTDAYYLIENAYTRLDKIDQGIEYFKGERQLHPDRVDIVINLGHLYYQEKDVDGAMREFSHAQMLDPEDPIPYVGMGVVALSQGNDTAAESLFTSALALDSLYAEARLYLGLIYERQGSFDAAEQEKARAYELKPSLKDVDISGVLMLRGEKGDIPFIVSSLDIILAKLIRPEVRKVLMEERKPFDLNLGLGFANINEDTWLSLSSDPEMDTDWIGLNLSLNFLFNKEGDIRTDEFDAARIVQRVRIGHPYLPVHVSGGAVQDYTFGYGLIVRNYFNQADENNRKIGGMFALQNSANTIGVQGMVNNVNFSEVMGARAFAGRWAPGPEDFLQRFECAGTFVQDAEYDLQIIGGDLLCYVASRGTFHFLIASEFAKILDHGMGNTSGLLLHIGGVSSRDVSFSLFGGGLFLSEDFVPAPFDAFYEKNRKLYDTTLTGVLLAAYDSSTTGLYAMAGMQAGPVMTIALDFQSVTDIPESNIFSARAVVGEQLPYVRLQAFFYRYNFSDIASLFEQDENTYLAGLAGIKLNQFLSVNVLYENTYAWQESSGSYEVQQKFSPFIQFGTTF
ncbi:tetratricopeptide repeat protein [candidate division WOR-3 bacterium]|nr:tetratricopeptide repeat protein [candidate division WOR-3 bacterium]